MKKSKGILALIGGLGMMGLWMMPTPAFAASYSLSSSFLTTTFDFAGSNGVSSHVTYSFHENGLAMTAAETANDSLVISAVAPSASDAADDMTGGQYESMVVTKFGASPYWFSTYLFPAPNAVLGTDYVAVGLKSSSGTILATDVVPVTITGLFTPSPQGLIVENAGPTPAILGQSESINIYSWYEDFGSSFPWKGPISIAENGKLVATATTNSKGEYTYTYTPKTSGTKDISVVAEGLTTDDTLNVLSTAPPSTDVVQSETKPGVGSADVLTGYVVDPSTETVAKNSPVTVVVQQQTGTFSIFPGGPLFPKYSMVSQSTTDTNSTGKFTYNFVPKKSGEYNVEFEDYKENYQQNANVVVAAAPQNNQPVLNVLKLNPIPMGIFKGKSLTVSGYVGWSNGQPDVNGFVDVVVSGQGQPYVETNTKGKFSVTVPMNQEGVQSVGSYVGSLFAKTHIFVNPSSTNNLIPGSPTFTLDNVPVSISSLSSSTKKWSVVPVTNSPTPEITITDPDHAILQLEAPDTADGFFYQSEPNRIPDWYPVSTDQGLQNLGTKKSPEWMTMSMSDITESGTYAFRPLFPVSTNSGE